MNAQDRTNTSNPLSLNPRARTPPRGLEAPAFGLLGISELRGFTGLGFGV